MFKVSSFLTLKFSYYSAVGILALILSACGPSPDVANFKEQAEVVKRELVPMTEERNALKIQLVAVTEERNLLKSRVEELSNTPLLLLAKVAEPVEQGNLKDAEIALHAIKEKFPQAPEATAAQKIVDVMRLKLDKQQEDARRLEALGFKALKILPVVDTGEVKLNVGAPSFTKQFTFDRYGDSYHYRDADRDKKYVVIALSATASKGVSNPDLPGFAIYWADGKQLRKIDKFDLQFVRWEDFATYLGNYSDSGNDFAKNATIPFTIGAHGPDEQMKMRPLYIIATKKGCLSRQYERFKNPPDYYVGTCAELEETLSLDSLSTERGNLTVVRRID